MAQIRVTAPNKETALIMADKITRFQPKQTRDIPASFRRAALAEGCDVEDIEPGSEEDPDAGTGNSSTEFNPSESEAKIKQIADEMSNMQAAGDVALLTGSGQPRVRILEERLGFETSAEEREAAEALLKE